MVKNKLNLFLLALLVLSLAVVAGMELRESVTEIKANKCLAWNREQAKNISGKNYSFAVLGDNNGDMGVFSHILSAVEKDPDISFAIHTGDLTYKSGKEEYRDLVKLVCQYLHKPLFIIPGNHDVGGDGKVFFKTMFGPLYYEFKAGRMRLVFLDASVEPRLDETQLSWLEQTLSGYKPDELVLVFMHQPLYDPRQNVKKPHCLSPEISNKLKQMFEKYGVSHIFTGHIHGFFEGNWDGIPYVISAGAGGERRYDTAPKDFFYNYLKVDVRGNSIKVHVVPLDMSRMDRIYFGAREYFRLETAETLLYALAAVSALILLIRFRHRIRLHGNKIL